MASGFKKIDTVPYLVVDVAGIALLTKFYVEEISDVAMCDRLRRIDGHLARLDESMLQHTVDMRSQTAVSATGSRPPSSHFFKW